MASFYVKNESRMISAFIWYIYCLFRSKIMNFQKSLYQMLAVKVGYFGATLQQNYATYDGVQRF